MNSKPVNAYLLFKGKMSVLATKNLKKLNVYCHFKASLDDWVLFSNGEQGAMRLARNVLMPAQRDFRLGNSP